MTQELSSLLEELIRRWREQDAKPRPGISKDAIRAFERREGVTLPDDMALYFETIDGMDHIDEEVFCFWPLEKVEPAGRNFDGPAGYLAFADFMINSNAYGIRVQGGAFGEVVALYGSGKLKPVASSFTEFLRKYMSDWMSLM